MALQEERSPEDIKSVWSKYGLRESPFTITPLRLLGILPIEKVFSGRETETKRLVKMLNSSSTTRTLVLGDYGVGKTTFVNYIKWALCLKDKAKSEFVTVPVEIKIQPNWDANGFLLSTLSSIYNASFIFRWEEDGMKLQSLGKIGEYVSIGTQKAIQGNIGIVGAGYSETKSIPAIISPEIYEGLLTSLCAELREEGKQLIISYDNLENIGMENLADFFKTIKDYIQIEGLHSIFIGPPKCLSALEKYPQVHSVFTQPTILEPLTEENVLEILKKRCEALKFKDGNYIDPYDGETVRDIYRKLNNIRFTFKVLEDTALFTEAQAPCKVTIKEIQAVQEREKRQIFSKLTQQETKIISTLMDINDKTTISKLAGLANIGSTNLTNPLKELEQKGLVTITFSEEDKRVKYVKLSENSYLKYVFAFEKIDGKS
jgi:DNA-binding MarR family transcriptional regulator